MGGFMIDLIAAFLAAIRVFFRSRADTSLEVLVLRQQVAVFKRKRPRPALTSLDRLFWTALRQLWPRWSNVLAIVKPGRAMVGQRSARSFGPSSAVWRSRTPAGERRGFTGNCGSLASRSLNARSPDIGDACGAAVIRLNAGLPSLPTIVRPSSPLISLLCPH